jgi:uncharacterized protein (TIGR02453 family)
LIKYHNKFIPKEYPIETTQFNGFHKDTINFLNKIQQNNNKVWFENHKQEYIKIIKTPSQEYINEMGEHLIALVPSIKAIPKVGGSLFRIYRDIRYSKDKTPMKSKIGFLFWQGCSHRMQSASFYMHYDCSEVFYATGIRNFKPPLLKAYREYIKNQTNAKKLDLILKDLSKKGYLLPPFHFKRYPSGFNKDDKYSYLSLYNAMFAYKIFPIDDIFFTNDKLIDRGYNIYEDMLDLHNWVYELTLSV